MEDVRSNGKNVRAGFEQLQKRWQERLQPSVRQTQQIIYYFRIILSQPRSMSTQQTDFPRKPQTSFPAAGIDDFRIPFRLICNDELFSSNFLTP